MDTHNYVTNSKLNGGLKGACYCGRNVGHKERYCDMTIISHVLKHHSAGNEYALVYICVK
jgi:hypothetical protein